ncbi:hypothetical protein BZA70DRAFT_279241 [Myxozyma melibiosi]|uniref:Uncharacterized protein n=1 Tax=Myxozyma melibiosi TaxID=54550 RepID=A0ABR1F5Q3_9ASCO
MPSPASIFLAAKQARERSSASVSTPDDSTSSESQELQDLTMPDADTAAAPDTETETDTPPSPATPAASDSDRFPREHLRRASTTAEQNPPAAETPSPRRSSAPTIRLIATDERPFTMQFQTYTPPDPFAHLETGQFLLEQRKRPIVAMHLDMHGRFNPLNTPPFALHSFATAPSPLQQQVEQAAAAAAPLTPDDESLFFTFDDDVANDADVDTDSDSDDDSLSSASDTASTRTLLGSTYGIFSPRARSPAPF